MKPLIKRVQQLEKEAGAHSDNEQFRYGAGDWTFEEIIQLFDNPTQELINRHNDTDWPAVMATLSVDELRIVAYKHENQAQ
ncbi:MAG: hypothetical protein VR69_00215 [Peptococcaceae bacterium BRH_c4b]|nr:MAG: hypothetical protein VR69_00215 [Peptococcaceae bacterium BRH_c4b]